MARPRSLCPVCAAVLPPRFRRPFAPHCRAGVHARRGSLRQRNTAVLYQCRTTRPYHIARPDGGRDRPALQTIGNAQPKPKSDTSRTGPAQGTMLASSQKTSARFCSRPHRPLALHCRAGVHACREDPQNPEGYWQGRVLHPSSRLTPTLPVCGARIALRVLKHTCVLRPLHLLRLAVSAAGGARLRSPLQGSLPGGRLSIKPPLQGEVDAPQGADGGGALPLCGGNIL